MSDAMSAFLDGFLVGGVLLASIVYALFSLGPRTLKRRVLIRAAAWVRSVPAVPGLRALSRRLETAAAGKPGGACGGCGDCGPGRGRPGARPRTKYR
jgi:hypothetical protein